jgi:hypothetical protein
VVNGTLAHIGGGGFDKGQENQNRRLVAEG